MPQARYRAPRRRVPPSDDDLQYEQVVEVRDAQSLHQPHSYLRRGQRVPLINCERYPEVMPTRRANSFCDMLSRLRCLQTASGLSLTRDAGCLRLMPRRPFWHAPITGC